MLNRVLSESSWFSVRSEEHLPTMLLQSRPGRSPERLLRKGQKHGRRCSVNEAENQLDSLVANILKRLLEAFG